MAVGRALAAGRDARRIGEAVLARLRIGFLGLLAPDLEVDERDATIEADALALTPAGITRALEVVGDAVTSMKEAVDPRVALETALVRVACADLDVAPSALLERIDRLERGVAPVARAEGPAPAEDARAALKKVADPPPSATPRPSLRVQKPVAATAAVPEEPPAAPESRPSANGQIPDRDALTLAWGDVLLDKITPRAKALFRGGHWVEAPTPTFALPSDVHRQRCEEVRLSVQEILSSHFGTTLTLSLVVDASTLVKPEPAPAKARPAADDVVEDVGDLSELEDAPPLASPAARLLEKFPGATEEPE